MNNNFKENSQSIYKGIIFDLGKVIFDYSFSRAYQFWATVSGKHLDDIKNKFLFDETFERFERGEISIEQFRATISKRLELNVTDEDFDNGWCKTFLDCYDGTNQLLADLKKHYRLVALTNTNILHERIWKEKFADTLTNFEKIFCSHLIGTRKPEEQSYKIVLEYLQLEPSETIFIDDNINNINGAKKLGITTIWVSSQQQMRKDIARLLIAT